MINPAMFLTKEQNETRNQLGMRKVETLHDVISLFEEGAFIGVLDAHIKMEIYFHQANPAAPTQRKIKIILPKWFHQHIPEEGKQDLLQRFILDKMSKEITDAIVFS